MAIDTFFNEDKAKGSEKILPRGAARTLLREMLEEQETLTGEPLTYRERKACLQRCHKILRNPIRRPDPFAHRLIMPNELYLDVSKAMFCVSDSGSNFDWLSTTGARLCGALALCAHDTGTAPATVSLGLFRPTGMVEENIESMLRTFDESHDITAVLVGRNTDLTLAADIAACLKKRQIKLNAHLGVHSTVAVHIASNDIIASPKPPGPVHRIQEMALFPLFERYSNPDKPYMMHMYYDDRKKDGIAARPEIPKEPQPE